MGQRKSKQSLLSEICLQRYVVALRGSENADAFVVGELAQAAAAHRSRLESLALHRGCRVTGINDHHHLSRVDVAQPQAKFFA